LLGVYEPVAQGDRVVVIGRYKSPGTRPTYCRTPANEREKPLQIERVLDNGTKTRVCVDDYSRRINIFVNDENLGMDYYYSVGSMVVLDGKTEALKFYQARGYTARGEDLGPLLRGQSFSAKGPGEKKLEPVGENLDQLHPVLSRVKGVSRIIKGEIEKTAPEEIFINGLWAALSMQPLKDSAGKIQGCILIFKDLTDIKRTELLVSSAKYKNPAFEKVRGKSPAIMNVLNLAQRAAASDSTILLLGESGTGKSMVAKLIHECSPRRDKPFVTVTLPAIPEQLLSSELFGYEEGAFTGARKNGHKGKIAMAEGGTLFLDEIGDMAFDLQSKLLHFIQERTYFPIGSNDPVTSNVRIIAATNQNLEELVAKGKFRLDLYYRLNVISLTMPPLRERREDIEAIIEDILPEIGRKVGKKQQISLSQQVMDILKSHNWPGNVRELYNVIERAVNICDGNVITVQDLPSYLKGNKVVRSLNLKEAVAQAERETIIRAIEEADNHRGRAMKLLGLGRTAFYKKLKEYEIGNYSGGDL